LPHNFIELIDASIAVLKGTSFNLYPDFPTGGMADFSRYNEGLRGGKVRVRAKIIEVDKKTLAITEVPFGTTTSTLIDSIISANDKGKIKIKKIEDNTAKNVEIILQLAPGISPDITIDALYAFTDCETSISPNSCVIIKDKPHFLSVNEILKQSTFNTKALLGKELEIKLAELAEKWHFSSLEKIFIEEKIYRDIEVAESEEQAVQIIDKRLEPFKALFKREITDDDILKLMEIRIKRITKYDAKKADELLRSIEDEITENKHHLKHLTDYTIAYFENLKNKYGKGRERKTEIRQFDDINATAVALANVKLYVNREDGFIGTGLKKDEFVCECSDIDDIIAFKADGTFKVTKIADKTFVGKNIIHVGVFSKNDERTVYNMMYRDGASGTSYMKRFSVLGVTRDKEYDLTKGSKGSSVLYFSANPNGEAEVVNITLKPHSKLRKLNWDIDFAELEIKGRGSQGNIITKYPVKKIQLKSKGVSTLAGRKIWFDEVLKRLNTDERGLYLGEFDGEDKIIVFYKDGSYELTNFDLANHYQEQIHTIQKFDAERIYAMAYLEGKTKKHFIKRFQIEEQTLNKRILLISDAAGTKLEFLTGKPGFQLQIEVEKGKSKTKEEEVVNIDDFIDVKGFKAQGNRLSQNDVVKIKAIEPVEEVIEEQEENNAPVDFEVTNPTDLKDEQQLGLF
jgi:topoisomerase IV subunit A